MKINRITTLKTLHLSKDGFIRMDETTLLSQSLVHLCSGLYEESERKIQKGGVKCDLLGYTEWISQNTPRISIGWDWELQSFTSPPSVVMTGTPFSNVLLQGDDGADFNFEETQSILSSYVSYFNWQDKLLTYLTEKYS